MRSPHISLTTQMVFAILLVISVTAFSTYISHIRAAERAIHETEVNRVKSLRVAITARVNDKIASMRTAAGLLREHPELVSALNARSAMAQSTTLGILIDRFYRILNVDLLEVMSHGDRVIQRAPAARALGDTLDLRAFEDALGGRESVLTASGRSGVTIKIVGPIAGSAEAPVVGALAMSARLDDRFLKQLAGELQVEITLASKSGAILATSLPRQAAIDAVDSESVTAVLAAQSGSHVYSETMPERDRGDTTVYFTETPSRQVFIWVATIDSRQALAQAIAVGRDTLRNALIFGVLSAALLGCLMQRYARRLTTLQSIGNAIVARIGLKKGDISPQGSRSEFEALEQILNVMATRLRTHTEELDAACTIAEAANRAKGNFLAAISHEIRTPISGVLGAAELLAGTPLDDQQQQYLAAVRSSGGALLEIITKILDFSKIETGRMALRPASLNLAELARDVTSLFSGRAQEAGLQLVCHAEPSASEQLVGDRTLIFSILGNLIDNAVKFTPAGRIAVNVKVFATVDNRAHTTLEVRDTGIGIATTDLAALFQPFAHAGHIPGSARAGTGLGLALAKRTAALMGGTLDVESEVGIGTVFRLTLDLPCASALVTDQIYPQFPISRTQPQRLRGRVLVAEDDKVNQMVVRGMLENIGLEVHVVADGFAAVEAAQVGAWDAVLMDCNMPVMNGFEATRAILGSEPKMAKMPIIALTANSFSDDADVCIDAGMDAFIAKPVRQMTLLRVLSRYLPCEPPPPDNTALLGRQPILEVLDATLPYPNNEEARNRASQEIVQLRDAARNGDLPMIQRTVWNLRQSCIELRAPQMIALCEEFLVLEGDNAVMEVQVGLPELEARLRMLHRALNLNRHV